MSSTKSPIYAHIACKFAMIGCYRQDCKFAHTLEEIRMRECRFAEACKNKRMCCFIHPDETIFSFHVRLNLPLPWVFTAEQQATIDGLGKQRSLRISEERRKSDEVFEARRASQEERQAAKQKRIDFFKAKEEKRRQREEILEKRRETIAKFARESDKLWKEMEREKQEKRGKGKGKGKEGVKGVSVNVFEELEVFE